jgi:hypothetical protein
VNCKPVPPPDEPARSFSKNEHRTLALQDWNTNLNLSKQNQRIGKMLCKFCHQEGKLIEAHVIPRSFFEIEPGNLPRVASNKDGVFPKRAPAGIYDPQLVCENCERLFSRFDDYAQRLLLTNREAAKPIYLEKQAIAYVYEQYDYKDLKLFFLSLLWRASESSHCFYQHIKLGPHEGDVSVCV